MFKVSLGLFISFTLVGCGSTATDSMIKITNGKTITDTDYPAVVGVIREFGQGVEGVMICTGTFISKRVVITAAHCVDGTANADGVLREPTDQVKGVMPQRIIRNPKYPLGKFIPTEDLAVLVYDKDMSDAFMPLSPVEPQVNNAITIVGFGRPSTDFGEGNGIKRVGYNTLKKRADGILEFEGELAPAAQDGSNAASAKGDSGGPMFLNDALIGITSGGFVSPENRKVSQYVDLYSPQSKAFFHHLKALGVEINVPQGLQVDPAPSAVSLRN